MLNNLEILFDGPGRHLVCLPYTVPNLHRMAEQLAVKRCWYHNSKRWPHYDAPKRRIADLSSRPDVTLVDSQTLFKRIRADREAQC